ncbi:MAG: radical SAM family heme chaperone HemW [Bacteroidales bacterium]|nr:radical SAM family heme chaperone HemW [Bacteroidales bacterium]
MIYVHVPFCRSFCTYCDFYSEVAAKCRKAEDIRSQEELFGRFAEALVSEAAARGHEMTDDVNTLYIGGGTPSVPPLSVYESLLSSLRAVGHGGPYDEFTVEVNPEDIVEKGEAYVEGLLKLGVNRISMGVQSFDDAILRFMNRRHDAATACKAYSVLENAGVGNISIDLIFGLPQLTDHQWSETLKRALDISSRGIPPQHISSYQLSVEPGSMLAKMVEKGKWSEASDELCERQYVMLCESLKQAGYNHYEISNFARPGYEALHNSAYWNHVPYVGLGPGAHSFLKTSVAGAHPTTDAFRQWNRPDLQAYTNDPLSVQEHETLDEEQLVLERIVLSLRTSGGIPENYLKEHCDPHVLERAFSTGDLVLNPDGNARIPESRFFISDSIISEIV